MKKFVIEIENCCFKHEKEMIIVCPNDFKRVSKNIGF